MIKSATQFICSFLFLILFGCTQDRWLDEHIIDEQEPNEQSYQANEISVGNTYRGVVSKPYGGTPDTDLFKIWVTSGTVVVFEFESNDIDFRPYVAHASSSGQNEFALFKTPGRDIAEFAAAVTGWHYFEIGDKRNVFEDGRKFGGFVYYFRVNIYHICQNQPEAILEESVPYSSSFSGSYGNIVAATVNIENNGFHQISFKSENPQLIDMFAFVYDCDGRQTVIGSDDEDYYSSKLDPLIYGLFNKDSDLILVMGRILADLTESKDHPFKIDIFKQLQNQELEPNNLYNYANRTSFGPVTGELDSKEIEINGIKGDDVDIFKYGFQKGTLYNFEIETENEKGFSAQLWAGSVSQTGSMIIPLRFSELSGKHKHHMNMYMPFTGFTYLFLEGKGVPYSFSVEETGQIDSFINFDNRVSELFEPEECKWIFRKWTMPKDGNIFEVKLSGLTATAGFHIFSSDHYPYAFVNPMEETRFYIHRYDKTEELVFGMYFSKCEQNKENIMDIKISAVKENYHIWDNGFESTPVQVDKDGSYQGFIDTDNYLIENIFTFTAWESGMLYLTTAPDINSLGTFYIDTVITLKHDSFELKTNDNTIEFINYNKFSFLTFPVKKGEQYSVFVKPFMSESSHIPSMNITGNYILDIRIK
jgi:hypothetical protein